jgi:ubiquinone/menaquinone biosynthesis C-methylase UbiE
VTFRYIEELGITEGWDCLEVGGGGGSVARWLSKKVGKDGHVLVTDINPSFLSDLEGDLGNVTVLRHDIADASDLPRGRFDLAHARLVLVHIPEREKALSNMVSTLKPGGWVMVEDFDVSASQALGYDFHPTKGVPPSMATDLTRKVMQARDRLLVEHGADLGYARRLFAMMTSNGLIDVGIVAEGMRSSRGGSPGTKVHLANTLQSRDGIIASGLVTEEELEEAIEMMEDPEWTLFSPLMISAWGRKPLKG